MTLNLNKNKIIIFFTLLIILFSAVAGYRYYRNVKIKQAGREPAEQIKKRQEEINKTFIQPQSGKLEAVRYEPPKKNDCDAKEGKEKEQCLDYFAANTAFINNKPEECGQINDPEIQYYCIMKFLSLSKDEKLCDIIKYPSKTEDCIKYAAFAAGKPELCQSIDEFEKKECLGPFMAYQAAASGKVEECKKIDVLEYANLCFERIINNLDRNCLLLPDKNDQILCQDIITYETALDTNNIKACDLITDNARKDVCVNFLTKGPLTDSDQDGIPDNKELWFTTDPFKADTDGDGLNDGEEMQKYYTNPMAADTDSDGYDDGEEIKKGFNPKGEGKLE